MHVLVIDDNRDTADTMQTLLELAGHQARVAYCGMDGVRIAIDWHPQVVLSDIGLPDINGFTVAQRLRENPELRDTTLVAISAYNTEATQKRAYESGFSLFLAKPADVGALLDTLVAKGRSALPPPLDPSQTGIVQA